MRILTNVSAFSNAMLGCCACSSYYMLAALLPSDCTQEGACVWQRERDGERERERERVRERERENQLGKE